MAISVNRVRNTILYFLSKNNYGYISPEELDSYGTMAQLAIFEDLFFEYNKFINLSNRRLTGTEYANIPKNLREQIDVFAEYTTQANFIYDAGNDIWAYNGSDLYRAENLSLVNGATSKKIDIDEVQKRELNVMQNSPLTTPSLLFPVYTRIGSDFRVFPIIPTGSYAELFFIRKPKDVKWSYIQISGNPIYNASASDLQDYELLPSAFENLVIKVLGYCGISLREEQIGQIAVQDYLYSKQQKES